MVLGVRTVSVVRDRSGWMTWHVSGMRAALRAATSLAGASTTATTMKTPLQSATVSGVGSSSSRSRDLHV